MTDIESVRRYVNWREEELLLGRPNRTVEDFEEYLRVADMEDRLAEIRRLAGTDIPNDKGGFLKYEEKLLLIAELSR